MWTTALNEWKGEKTGGSGEGEFVTFYKPEAIQNTWLNFNLPPPPPRQNAVSIRDPPWDQRRPLIRLWSTPLISFFRPWAEEGLRLSPRIGWFSHFPNAGRIFKTSADCFPSADPSVRSGFIAHPWIVSEPPLPPPPLSLSLSLPPQQHNSPHVVRTEAEKRDPTVSPSRRVCGVSEKIF